MAHSFHVGTFLLLCAAVLLLVSTITAPVVHNISLLKISTANGGSSTTFGALGYCSGSSGSNGCSPKHVGYDIAAVVSAVTGASYSSSSLKHLTSALVLHPVATGLTFIAFFIALLAHRIGFIFASFIAALAWVVTAVLLIIDFAIFGSVKHHVNDLSNGVDGRATFGTGIWLVVAAFVILFFASFITCCGCFTERRHRKSSR